MSGRIYCEAVVMAVKVVMIFQILLLGIPIIVENEYIRNR